MAMPTSGRTYFIFNSKKKNTVLDLCESGHTNVLGCGFHGRTNQRWKIEYGDDGWTIQNGVGRYLDILDPPDNGVQVIAVNTRNPRLWDIKPDETDSNGWRIIIQKSNQNVDSDQGSIVLGTPVTLLGEWSGENQVWKFEEVP